MAKRDKLYTINRWNKPLFEEERRRKLYLGGGNKNTPYGFNPYLHTGLDQALQTAGLYHGWGNDYQTPVEKNAASNQLITNSDYRGNYNPVMDQVRTYVAPVDQTNSPAGEKKPEGKLQNIITDALGTLNGDFFRNLKNNTSVGNTVTNTTSNTAPRLVNPIKSNPELTVDLSTTTTPTNQLSRITPESFSHLGQQTSDMWHTTAEGISKALKARGLPGTYTTDAIALPGEVAQPTTDAAKTAAAAKIAKDINDAKGIKLASKAPSGAAQLGVNLAGQVVGDLAQGLIAPKMGDYTKVDDIIGYARHATPLLNFIPGGQWWLPSVANAALGVVSGLARPIFGGYVENADKVKADIARLNSINPNGSNEFIANLLSSPAVVRNAVAKGHNSLVNKAPGRDADNLNETADYAQNELYRRAQNAIYNNNIMQLQNAYNDNTWSAMGGKLNRKKCNCKAEGGILNTSINPVSAAGYDILSTYLTTQAMKNQASQDTGSSIGNSFMGTDTGTLFADGGNIHINPAHKGEFTAKAKRHGMGVQQFANHVLAHKDKFPTSTVRQAVFAKNSHTWKKAFGGKLNYGKDKDIRDNSFFDEPTLFALGGVYQAGGSNWGQATETQASVQNKGYNVGDVIEIDESEAQLLKKLGYEYKIVG